MVVTEFGMPLDFERERAGALISEKRKCFDGRGSTRSEGGIIPPSSTDA
ncbi:hypothetical protein ABIA00_003141 [Bradyrhizobium ottawaense]